MTSLQIRDNLEQTYSDVFTPEVLSTLSYLSYLNNERLAIMKKRMERRQKRAENLEMINFLNPDDKIDGINLTVQDARSGKFIGPEIPADLQCQWIQGTGPGAKPNTTIERSIRNVAYALLSGADGWMFDGEDALCQISTMSLDNQRNLKLAISAEDIFLQAAEQVANEMNKWSVSFLGRETINDWQKQLNFTTKIFIK